MEQQGETGMPPHMHFQGGRGPSGPPRPAPSMPNMRHRIQVGHDCGMSRNEFANRPNLARNVKASRALLGPLGIASWGWPSSISFHHCLI